MEALAILEKIRCFKPIIIRNMKIQIIWLHTCPVLDCLLLYDRTGRSNHMIIASVKVFLLFLIVDIISSCQTIIIDNQPINRRNIFHMYWLIKYVYTKDTFDNISACKHGMTELLAWQSCVDGFPTAAIMNTFWWYRQFFAKKKSWRRVHDNCLKATNFFQDG
jgi:hypothetical protein